MDSYPGDLLAGVFPLVFAVDATAGSHDSSTQKNPNANEKPLETSPSLASSTSTRSLFDRFLDALAASLVDDEEASPARAKSSDAFAGLLRTDEESSDEDDISFTEPGARRNSRKTSPMTSFLHLNKRGESHIKSQTAYANYSSGEGFFQRARILSISTRHGFPPSKDPDGSRNRATLLSQARSTMALGATSANADRLKRIMEQQPVDGILPVGWLEKHVHALPSTLLVITSLLQDSNEEQDQRLLETIEHLQESLAPKRECHIHIVCFIEDMAQVSQSAIDTWFDKLHASSAIQSSDVSLLSKDDLVPTSTKSSPALRGLHKTVRDASLAYYLRQARSAKRKHSILGHERQPSLLPLAIRYCFKIGLFYEFQLKHAKSLRFFAEAYRHIETYYHFLLGVATPTREVLINPQSDDLIEMNLPETEASTAEDSIAADPDQAGIEIALADEDDGEPYDDSMEEARSAATYTNKVFNIEAPDDMAHQCRAVADWLNFKLLQAGFLSSAYTDSPEGVVAASAQWRRHAQSFFRKDAHNPLWNHWSYISHQRLVMSQLAERHKPRSAEGLTDEITLLCSAWRNYQAATEAVLRLGLEVQNERLRSESSAGTNQSDKTHADSLRKRFVGGLISDGLAPTLEQETRRNHKESALEMVLRAIALFEQEIEVERKTENNEDMSGNSSSLRTGARLYYLAGGILLGEERHEEAIPYLESATRFSSEWPGLELASRRMLIACYEKHDPNQLDDPIKQSETICSAILDSCISAGVSSWTLRKALENFAALGGGKVLKCTRVCMEESHESLPFSFSVTFPGITHATAEETVTSSVYLKSNLDYAIHLKNITLLSMAGPILVPSSDLQSAKNTNGEGEDGIIMQANASILISTQVDLPRDLSMIAADESGSVGEKQGAPGKGSLAKSARPRTAGITSAAGARMVSEKVYGSGPSSQWSVSCLGGKTFRCDAIRLVFTPAQVDKLSSPGSVAVPSLIDFTIEKKKPIVPANIKRTPFEEDNYVGSAWSRAAALPYSYGPRCLRVLGPMPKMSVTNLTNDVVNGKALEGTVNRVLLKLKAGPDELCQDVKYQVSCSSSVLCKDGTTRNLSFEETDLSETEKTEKRKDSARIPVVVRKDTSNDVEQSTALGLSLPVGWRLVGNGRESLVEEALAVSTLKAGEETYMAIDFYRSPQSWKALGGAGLVVSSQEDMEEDLCQTDFSITISYRQARDVKTHIGKEMTKPSEEDATTADIPQEEAGTSDFVSLEHSGSIVWASPIGAEFSVARSTKAYPSGSRHPTNLCLSESASPTPPPEDPSGPEIALIDGERINAKCILRPKASLGVEIDELRFEDANEESAYEKAWELRHIFNEGESGLLYEASPEDISRRLTKGSKFGLTYSVQVKMLDAYKKGSISARLGVVCVLWKPLPIPVPDDVLSSVPGSLDAHGPLTLQNPSVIKFLGPACYVENAPFETVLQSSPALPRVAVPFELSYRISNKTGMHQKLSIVMKSDLSSEGEEEPISPSEGILVSGLVNGEIRLSPFESQTISYTALAMQAGKVTMPALSISSDRYKTWVLNGDYRESRQLYVLP